MDCGRAGRHFRVQVRVEEGGERDRQTYFGGHQRTDQHHPNGLDQNEAHERRDTDHDSGASAGGVGTDCEARARPRQLRLAEAGAVLLEAGEGHGHDQHRRRRHRVLLRVPGGQGAAGGDAPDRQMLHHVVAGLGHVSGRRPRRPRRDRQDGDHEGSGAYLREVRGRVQLLRSVGLQGHGQDLQRSGPVRGLGLLRRVQSDRPPRALRVRSAGGVYLDGAEAAQIPVRVHRRAVDRAASIRRVLHHHESRIRRAAGAAREPQGAVPWGVHDGARSKGHQEGEAGRRRVQRE
mmetsp:Transcript_20779/g.35682  ORF Transcript_20779/g.35682 Transcript_20779/m.35682 type:complete len:291 (+) Transcript_20779:5167-6039(+)